MTREEKDLLLKDLCARLPYGVKILDIPTNVVGDLFLVSTTDTVEYETNDDTGIQTLYNIKPYLFPLSSMTEKMIEELNTNGFFKYRDTLANVSHLISNGKIAEEVYTYIDIEGISLLVELFHKHHIDYKGLIERGLALDATDKNIY